MITRQTIMDSFRAVRNNTLQVAKDIPAEKYDFVPAEGTEPVLGYLKRIIRMTELMTNIALSREPIEITPATRAQVFASLTNTNLDAITNKDQLIDALAKSFSDIESRVNAADENFLNEEFLHPDKRTKSRLWVINNAKEQEMSVRGQLYLIERMLGIVPHTTRAQQERERAAAQS